MSDGDSDDGFVFIEDDLIGRPRPKHRTVAPVEPTEKPEERNVVLVSSKPVDGNNVGKASKRILGSTNGEGNSQLFAANQFNLVHDTQSEMTDKRMVADGKDDGGKAVSELNSNCQPSTVLLLKETMSQDKEESLPMNKPAGDKPGTSYVATDKSKTTEEEDAEYMKIVENYHQAKLAKNRLKEAVEALQSRNNSSSSSPSRHSSRRSSVSSSEVEQVQSDDEAAPVVQESLVVQEALVVPEAAVVPEAVPEAPALPVESPDVNPPENRVDFLSHLCAAILKSKQHEQVPKKTEEVSGAKDESAETKEDEISEEDKERALRVIWENHQSMLEQVRQVQERFGVPAVPIGEAPQVVAAEEEKPVETEEEEVKATTEGYKEGIMRAINENRQSLLEKLRRVQNGIPGAPVVPRDEAPQVMAAEEEKPVEKEEKATAEKDEDAAYVRQVNTWHQKQLEKSCKALSSGTVVSSGETSQVKAEEEAKPVAKEEKATAEEDEDAAYVRQVNAWHQKVLEKNSKPRGAQEVSIDEESADREDVQQQNTVLQYTSDELKNLRKTAVPLDTGKTVSISRLSRSDHYLCSSDAHREERHRQSDDNSTKKDSAEQNRHEMENNAKKEIDVQQQNTVMQYTSDELKKLRDVPVQLVLTCTKLTNQIEELRKNYKQNGGARGYVMTDAERKRVEELRKNPRNDANAPPVQMFSQLNLGESSKEPATTQTQYAVQHPDGKVYKIKCDPTPKPADDVKTQQPISNPSEQAASPKKADQPVEPAVKKSNRYDIITPETNLVPHPEYPGQWTTEEFARNYVKSDHPPPFVTVPPTIANTTREAPNPIKELPLRQGREGVYRPYDSSLEGTGDEDRTKTEAAKNYHQPAPVDNAYAPQQAVPVAVVPEEETAEEAEARRAEEIRKSEEFIALMGMQVVEHDAMIHLLNATNKRQAEQRRLMETGAGPRELTEQEVDDLLEGRVKASTLRNREFTPKQYGVPTNPAYPVPPVYPNQSGTQSYAPPPVPAHISTNYPLTSPSTSYSHPPQYPSPPAPPQNAYQAPRYPVTHPYMAYTGKNQNQQYPSGSNYQPSQSGQQYPSSSNYQLSQSGQQYPSGSSYQQSPSQSGQQYTDTSYRYPALYPATSQQNYYPQQTSVQAQPQQYVGVEPRSLYPQNAHYTSNSGGYPQATTQPTTSNMSYGGSLNNAPHYVSPIDDTYQGFIKTKPRNHDGYCHQAPTYPYTAPSYPYTAPSYPYTAPVQTSSYSTPAVYINDDSSPQEIRRQIIKFITDYNKSGQNVYLSTFFKPPSVITYNFDVVLFAQTDLKDIVTLHSCLTNDIRKEYLFELKQ